jgi:hypothetical protein
MKVTDSRTTTSQIFKDIKAVDVTTTTDSGADRTMSQKTNDESHIESEQNVEVEYITGYKLAVVVACVALSCFLMLLDTMIISTVSRMSLPYRIM